MSWFQFVRRSGSRKWEDGTTDIGCERDQDGVLFWKKEPAVYLKSMSLTCLWTEALWSVTHMWASGWWDISKKMGIHT